MPNTVPALLAAGVAGVAYTRVYASQYFVLMKRTLLNSWTNSITKHDDYKESKIYLTIYNDCANTFILAFILRISFTFKYTSLKTKYS